jgi:TetR/AcrR family transcriptional regulator, cholesterol catabolism regulator
MRVTATKPVVDHRPPRREVILDCAARLFAEQGYEGTSLGDLAESASMAKATLFHYFHTKEAILFELYNHAVGAALDTVRSVEANADPEVELRAMLREHALVIMKNERLYQVFFSEEKGLEPEHLEIIRAQQVTYLNLVAERVRALQLKNRVASSVHPRVAAQVMLGIGSWTYRWFDSTGNLDMEDIADFTQDLSIRGLFGTKNDTDPSTGAPPGH